MISGISVNAYHFSKKKQIFDLLVGLCLLFILSPLLLLIALTSFIIIDWPVLFFQDRTGQNNRTFRLIKFRTMTIQAERLKANYQHLNEASFPIFKIYNDPRYSTYGRFLAHTGLDELPQLLNVIKRDMSLVGPRPLPTQEAKQLRPKFNQRHLIKPGMTSSWVVEGAHRLNFKTWQKLDLEYVQTASLKQDMIILIKTVLIVMSVITDKVFGKKD